MKTIRYKVEFQGDLLIRTTTINLAKLNDLDLLIPFVEYKIKKRFGNEYNYDFDHSRRYVKVSDSQIRKKTFIINGKPIELYVGG